MHVPYLKNIYSYIYRHPSRPPPLPPPTLPPRNPLPPGFPDYGVHVNRTKTALNFDMRLEGALLPRNELVEESGRRFVRWCGLLVNADTLEMQVRPRDGPHAE